jgi:hypothetical protein
MFELKNIELIIASCFNAENGVRALRHSIKDIKFGKVTIFSPYKPRNITNGIDYVYIEKQTPSTMNSFAIKELPKYYTHDYVLSIHDDGFIINPHLWTNEFLQYDFIGAPWPPLHWNTKNRVGNMGFFMKSKKFTDLELQINYINGPNDWLVTNYYYDSFIECGCRYAPINIAAKFSMELPISEIPHDLSKSFGFHGKYTEEAKEKCKLLEQYE